MKLKEKQKKYLGYFIKGIYAGLMISIGGIVYLSVENPVAGSFLFSIGLLMVCMYKMNLYTGMVGFIFVHPPKFIFGLLVSLLGNLCATLLVGQLMRLTRLTGIVTRATTIVNTKLTDNLFSIFILAVFCGMLMYIAVNNYRTSKSEIGKYVGIFMGVMTFILCGFEHCVANMFYFSVAGVLTFKVLLYLIVMILGNSVGSMIISLFYNTYYED